MNHLDRMLRSEAAPAECMTLSELDGFLTGIAVGPRNIPQHEWLSVALGAPGRVTATSRLAMEMVTAIQRHYEGIVATLRDEPENFQPIFWKGPNGAIHPSAWAEGFAEAMQLRLEAWTSLTEDDENAYLMMPILSLCRDARGLTLVGLDAAEDKGTINQLARMIPVVVTGIRDHWRGLKGRVGGLVPVGTVRRAPTPGRNDPCPCGSGKKYKRCCDGKPAVPSNTLTSESELASYREDASDRGAGKFSIPAKPREGEEGQERLESTLRWVEPGELLEVQGIKIRHGMVYTGSSAKSSVSSLIRSLGIGGVTTASQLPAEDVEPSRIDPSLPIKTGFKEANEGLPFDAKYASMTPVERGRYLLWLSTGAQYAIDSRYVRLYFMGLERRLLVDTVGRPAEAVPLLAELDRLAERYGQEHYLCGHIARLKEYVQFRDGPPAVAGTTMEWMVGNPPFAMRYALGVYARDRRPLPSGWAALLALEDEKIPKRTAVERCPEVFAKAFSAAYAELYGEGLLLPRNKTQLEFTYYPDSLALRRKNFRLSWADIPDVLATTGPRKKLMAAVEKATLAIDSYSRFIGRFPDRGDSLQAALTLPASCWPAGFSGRLQSIREKFVETAKPFTFSELMSLLDPRGKDAWTAGMVTGLAKALAGVSIGMEPDVLAGARKPAPGDAVVLFPLSATGSETPDRSSVEFRKAGTAVSLLCAVAQADEKASLSGNADAWIAKATRVAGLVKPPPDLSTRLRARYRLLRRQGVKISSLKVPMLEFSADERVALASLLTSAANAGGAPSLAAVRMLEQIYSAFQLDERLVYTHLHSGGERHGGSAAVAPKAIANELDSSRIAQLRRETDAVSALLANVFAEEEIAVPVPVSLRTQEPAIDSPLPGLDAAHAEFAARLLAQPQWSRGDLEAVAAGLRLMLDSAVERINDAALDHLGEILLEGDDSIEVRMELLEGVTR